MSRRLPSLLWWLCHFIAFDMTHQRAEDKHSGFA